MSSVLSTWFYILTLGIALLLFVALVFIFFKPDMFLQLTSASGQLVDLTGMDDFDPSLLPGITAQSAVIKVGANSYVIANDFTPNSPIPNAFVNPTSKLAATDVAGAKVTGTFMFWLLMLGIGFLTLLLAFIAVKYPAKLFGPQVSALVGCLPKTKSPCSSSSSCSAPVITPMQPTPTLPSVPVTPPPVVVTPTPRPPVIVKPVTPPPAPKPAVPTSGFTPAQLAVLQQIMAAMATVKPTAPVA